MEYVVHVGVRFDQFSALREPHLSNYGRGGVLENEVIFSFDQLGNGWYQFDSAYDDVQLFTVDGKEIFDHGDFQFSLDRNSVYVVIIVAGQQRMVRKLCVLE